MITLEDWEAAQDFRRTAKNRTTALAVIVRCLGCSRPTMGSIGAAGYFWRSLCQECKDKADADLKTELKSVLTVLDLIRTTVLQIFKERKNREHGDSLQRTNKA